MFYKTNNVTEPEANLCLSKFPALFWNWKEVTYNVFFVETWVFLTLLFIVPAPKGQIFVTQQYHIYFTKYLQLFGG